ncbi:MAG: hypothetical protein V1740_05235 [Candidatus Woesearchaeota archaeon]
MKVCSYSGICSSNPNQSYSISPALSQASYSHDSSPTSIGYSGPQSQDLGYTPMIQDSLGYSALPSQLDYHITEALKELDLNQGNLPAVREEDSPIKVIPSGIQIISPKKDAAPEQWNSSDHNISPEQMMELMKPDNKNNLPQKIRPKKITQIEEKIVIQRRIRSVEFSD